MLYIITRHSVFLEYSFKHKIFLNPYRANIFVQKMSAFTSAAYTVVHFRLDFIMDAKTMNPDQTADCS